MALNPLLGGYLLAHIMQFQVTRLQNTMIPLLWHRVIVPCNGPVAQPTSLKEFGKERGRSCREKDRLSTLLGLLLIQCRQIAEHIDDGKHLGNTKDVKLVEQQI